MTAPAGQAGVPSDEVLSTAVRPTTGRSDEICSRRLPRQGTIRLHGPSSYREDDRTEWNPMAKMPHMAKINPDPRTEPNWYYNPSRATRPQEPTATDRDWLRQRSDDERRGGPPA